MKEIHLLGKKIIMDRSKVLLSYQPGPDWQDYFQVMAGQWEY